jgi:hypothetical protein
MGAGATAVDIGATGAVGDEVNATGDSGRGTATAGLILLDGSAAAGRLIGAARLATVGRGTVEVTVVGAEPEFADAADVDNTGRAAEATFAGRMGPAANAGGRRVGRLGAS